jgi:predicted Holliday junction resolvase-like endonuclease
MTDLFQQFQEFRKILCVCPRCRGLTRVSDLRLKVKGPSVLTWLDSHEKKEQILARKEEKFGEIEDKLREKATERGRREAEKVFNNAICSSLRALKLDPFDIKPILNPVDFIVFNGMTKKESISEIIFLTKKDGCPSLNSVRCQIKSVILKNKYDWQVARIDEKGCILFE